MKKVFRILFILHLLVGIGAIGGGMMAILNPQGPGGMPTDLLNNSPFHDFLIPGIILFTVIGLGNVFSALSLHLKSRYQGYISSIFSWALVIWIVVQCIMLQTVVFLHVLFFIIGLVGVFLSSIVMLIQNLFPVNIILDILAKMEERFPDNAFIIMLRKLERNTIDRFAK